MFGPLGVPEIIFLLVLALLIFGPRKLPEIGRTLGKGMAEFRKASNELRRTLNAEALEQELRESDPRRILEEKYPAKPIPVKRERETPAEETPAEETPTEEPSSAEPRATIERPADTVARGGSDEDGSEDGPKDAA